MRALVHKFPLTLTDSQVVRIPYPGKILDIREQHGVFCMWVLFDAQNNSMKNIRINIMGTGKEILHNPGNHICTRQDSDGFVWHFFTPESQR